MLITLALLFAAWIYVVRTGRHRGFAGATLAAAVLLLLIGVANCGGGGGSTVPPPPIGTTAGQYTVTITGASTGASGSLSRTAKLSLTVQ